MPSEAEKKLVENLLPFMDTFSIFCLTQAHKPVLDVVLGKTVWNKLIQKVCVSCQVNAFVVILKSAEDTSVQGPS